MGNTAAALPYSIGDQIMVLPDGWTLHKGQRKSDGAEVSVFYAKKPQLLKAQQLDTALNHFMYCKKLRHPHILTVHATLDTDNPQASNNLYTGQETSSSSMMTSATSSGSGSSSSASGAGTGDLMIVTEPCIPINAWLHQDAAMAIASAMNGKKGDAVANGAPVEPILPPPSPEQLAWGLEGAVRALHFMHASANLAHAHVCPHAFFVTRAGDVKLFQFSLTTPVQTATGGLCDVFRKYEASSTPDEYRSPERKQQQWTAIQAAGSHAMDSFAMGIFIGYYYQYDVPPPLQKAVQRMQTPNLKMRPRLQPLLKCPLFDTPFQKIQLQLEEFAIQPVESKINFWQTLVPSLQAGLMPVELARYKLLPLIKTNLETICQADSIRTQDLYRKEVLAMLPPLFFIAEQYLGEMFAKELASLIALLFSVNDRGIRGSLLKRAQMLTQYLDNSSLNGSVFEPMCSGFSDSAAPLRELTLKATLALVPHLTPPNLEKLSRYLVRLQTDTEPSIRTNTVIFFAKLAPYLTDMSRQKLLLPAFLRGLQDPFTPCRLAALQSTLQTKQFFEPVGVAAKVLPAITPCCVDPSEKVRHEAFGVVEQFLAVLRAESERLSHIPEANETGQQPGGAAVPPSTAAPPPAPKPVAPAPSSGGYFSSWMSSSSSKAAPAPAPAAAPAPPPVPRPVVPVAPATAPVIPITTSVSPDIDDDDWPDDDGDGWNDDDLDVDDSPAPVIAAPPKRSGGGLAVPKAMNNNSTLRPVTTSISNNNNNKAPVVNGAGKNDDDDFFSSFDNKPAKPAIMAKKAPVGSSKLKVPAATAAKKAPKPAVQKLAVDDDIADGWDDF